MSVLFALALLVAAKPLSFAERVDGECAVERARYTFVIGAARPFDEAYPRSVFEKKVIRELAEEEVLSREFGMRVTEELLLGEYDRIERETRAPDQWEAVKKALGGFRRRVEEIVCRPILVDRALRARFAFDQKVHAGEHQRARLARETFLAGKTPINSVRCRLSRRSEPAMGTDELLEGTRAGASPLRVLSSTDLKVEQEKVLTPDPEMSRVLERQLNSNGNVTAILEEWNRFSVFRSVTSDASEWIVDAVWIPKREFDEWLEVAAGKSACRLARSER
jgi:hypothetical protein